MGAGLSASPVSGSMKRGKPKLTTQTAPGGGEVPKRPCRPGTYTMRMMMANSMASPYQVMVFLKCSRAALRAMGTNRVLQIQMCQNWHMMSVSHHAAGKHGAERERA